MNTHFKATIRSLLDRVRSDTAHVEEVNQLPAGTGGRTYRYEIVVRLADSVDSAPSEGEVREIADTIRSEIDDIDGPDWEGADELWIQVYAPGRDTDAGACGTAHWLADGGYETVETRDYMF